MSGDKKSRRLIGKNKPEHVLGLAVIVMVFLFLMYGFTLKTGYEYLEQVLTSFSDRLIEHVRRLENA